jgi:3-phosphoshikimate 1-carboxyvinyltransferase
MSVLIPTASNMPTLLPIRPFTSPVTATARIPGSKSITNRALVLAALAEGPTTLTGALFSRDTRIMLDALRTLGFDLHADEAARTIRVHGLGGKIPVARAALDFGNSGTSARFLTALLALHPHGEYQLDGDPALRARPMRGLLQALASQGVTATAPDGSPATNFPFTLRTCGLQGGTLTVDASESSQILTALLMVAPLAQRPAVVRLEGKTVSEPFVEMTLRMMSQFGSSVDTSEKGDSVLQRGFANAPGEYAIEPDATAASYFLALPAVAPATLTLEGLRAGLQGDIDFARILQKIGIPIRAGETAWTSSSPSSGKRPSGGDFDFNAISDTFLTLAALAPLLAGPLTIRGIAHARKQETDRLLAVATELERLGQRIEPSVVALREDPTLGAFTIYPDLAALLRLTAAAPVNIRTYEDHRIAMSFGVLGCHDLHGDGRPWIAIEDPACCGKTFPGFFDELERLRRAA